ncbi:MAG: DUF308 domain-containing protein [Bacteroidales bacterium]|nr:DUF308 domain-containing protein [Bacteroidales bacterium]
MKRHFENLTNKVSRAIKHWWLLMLAGLLCVAMGIVVFVFPLESYVTLAILFGVLMLAVGAAQLIIASSSGNYLAMRGYMIVGGVLDLILGIFLCIYPYVTLMVLPIMMGIWMMYHSFMIIAFGGDMETFKLGGSGLVIAGGILLLLLSILVLVNPLGAGVTTVVVIAGIGLLVFGGLLCALSLKMKDIDKELNL